MDDLTRDSDMYDDALRKRVINDATGESQLGTLTRANIRYDFDWEATNDMLTEEGCEGIHTHEELVERQRQSAASLGEEFVREGWNATGVALATIQLWLPLTLPDGETVEVWLQHRLDSQAAVDNLATLLSTCGSDYPVTATLRDTYDITIEIEGTSFDVTIFDEEASDVWHVHTLHRTNAPYPSMDHVGRTHFTDRLQTNKAIIESVFAYATNKDRWQEGRIGDLQHDDTSVYVPIYLGETKACTLSFPDPEADDQLWTFADAVGVDDPLLAEDEPVWLSLDSLDTTETDRRVGIWNVSYQKPAQPSSLFSRLRELL